MSDNINLLNGEYDGEVYFDIKNIEYGDSSLSFEVSSNSSKGDVGMKVIVPTLKKKMLFKSVTVIDVAKPLAFSSVGPQSDTLVEALAEIYKPEFVCSNKFTNEPALVDFAISNKELFELDTDKVFLRIFYAQDDSFEGENISQDERISIELQFSFNLSRKRACLTELKKGYTADFLTVIMA